MAQGIGVAVAMSAVAFAMACSGGGEDKMVFASEHPSWLAVRGLGPGGELLFCERERGVPRGTIAIRNDGPDAAHVRIGDGAQRELDLPRGEEREVEVEGGGDIDRMMVSAWWPVPPNHYEADYVRNVRVPLRRTLDPGLFAVMPKRTNVVGRRQAVEVVIEKGGATDAQLSFEVEGPFEIVGPIQPFNGPSSIRVELRLTAGAPGDVQGALHLTAPGCDGAPRRFATVPLTAKRGSRVVEITGGTAFTCARLSDGTVSCFGADDKGQLGRDPASLTNAYARKALVVPGVTKVERIASGRAHTCIVSDGNVSCWGDASKGQCGPAASGVAITPVKVALPTRALGIYAGADASCATLDNGRLSCWGVDTAGTPNVAPAYVGFVSGAKSVAIGADHVCAVDELDELWCWGAGGRIGDGTDQPAAQPKNVSAPPFVGLAAGDTFTCGISPLGALDCWGLLVIRGQLGQHNSLTRVFPPPGATGPSIPRVNASGDKYCWFDKSFECDGFAKTMLYAGKLEAFAVGGNHYCLLDDGGVRCDSTDFDAQPIDIADHDENGLLEGLQGE